MGTLYLKLSKHMYDITLGTIVGLSIDKDPNRLARDLAAAEEVSAADEVRRSVTLNVLQKGVTCLKIKTPDDRVETVVLTLEACVDLVNPIGILSMECSLTRHSTLEIKAVSPRMSLMLLNAKLASLATGITDRCQAHVADCTQCLFEKINRRWCPFHTDQHDFLHDDLLKERKPWHEAVRDGMVYRREDSDNIGIYNRIQESLAIRTIISQVLYAGEEDDGHRKFVVITRQNRANVATQLSTDGSNGSGRVNIYSQIQRFVDEARNREAKPIARQCWRDELTVKLADVRDVEAYGGRDPSVHRLYTNTGAVEMEDIFWDKAIEYGNLPVIVPQPVVAKKRWWELTPAELQEEWPRRYGSIGLPIPTPQEVASKRFDVSIWDKLEKGEPLTAAEQRRNIEMTTVTW